MDISKVYFCNDPIYAAMITLEKLFKNINPVPDRATHEVHSKKQGEIIFDIAASDAFVNVAADGAAPVWKSLTEGTGGGVTQDDLNNAIATHTSNASAHHVRVTSAEVMNWVKANDGPGSGVNADLLDGYHYTSFAWKSHSHSYLPLAGGTLSGNLSMGTYDLLFSSGSVKMSDDTGISGAIDFSSGASNYIQRQYVGNNYVQVYNMDRQHSFSIAGTEKLRIDASQVELFSKLNANGQTIEKANIAGTEATSFMLNQDLPESSVGVNCAFKVNRGASGTEARLLWDEGGNKWCCDADGVYCPLQVSRLYLSSDTYLYKDGSGNLVLHAGTGGVKFE